MFLATPETTACGTCSLSEPRLTEHRLWSAHKQKHALAVTIAVATTITIDFQVAKTRVTLLKSGHVRTV
jgi:hypothetical protein